MLRFDPIELVSMVKKMASYDGRPKLARPHRACLDGESDGELHRREKRGISFTNPDKKRGGVPNHRSQPEDP
jgi:hypothetical protein